MSNTSKFAIKDDQDTVEFEKTSVPPWEEQPNKSKQAPDMPTPLDPEWSEWVISQLADDEKQDGKYPKTDGLRRLVNKLVGPIVASDTEVLHCPTYGLSNHSENTSTVKVTITVQDFNFNKLVYSACADASVASVNTAPFNLHLSAIAETRAEGRVLRKILGLKNIVTADEINGTSQKYENAPVGVSSPDLVDDIEPITGAQISWLKKECSSLNVNIKKFVNDYLQLNNKKTVDNIYKFSRNDARELGVSLSEFKNESNEVPDHLKGYQEDDFLTR